MCDILFHGLHWAALLRLYLWRIWFKSLPWICFAFDPGTPCLQGIDFLGIKNELHDVSFPTTLSFDVQSIQKSSWAIPTEAAQYSRDSQ